MPSLADLEKLIPVATSVAQGINNSGAVSSATNNLATGATQAMGTITDASKAAQGTLDASHADSQGLLAPYQQAGTDALTTLQNGLKPGGGMADPFTWLPVDLQNDPIFQRRLKQGQDAIAAKANAGGTRFSGASMKDFADYATGSANDYLAQDYARHESTFRANQADAFNRNLALEQQGQRAASEGVNENTNYGASTVGLTVGTSKAIAELQTEKASALAAGNLAQARVLDNAINGLSSAATNMSSAATPQAGTSFPPAGTPGANPQAPPETDPYSLTPEGGTNASAGLNPDGTPMTNNSNAGDQVENMPGSIGTIAGPATSLAAGAFLGGGSAAAIPVSSVAISGIPEAAAAGESIAGASIPGSAGATGGAFGGIESGLQAVSKFLMNNPWTIGVGAAITAALIWKNSQVHQTSSKWTDSVQTQFGQHLGSIVNGFDKAFASGQLTKEQGQVAYQQTADLINSVEQKAAQFASQNGSKGRTVIDQFHAEMLKDFGPGYAGILQKMQSEIQGLPE